MRNVRSSRGPLSERPHFSLTEIEEMCTSELRRVSLYPPNPEPIRIERFIEKRFGLSPRYEELPHGVLGFTQFGEGGVEAIVVSKAFENVGANKSTERRLRTTLAHEAGHGLMHAHLFCLGGKPASLFDDDTSSPEILCRDVVGVQPMTRGYDGRWWEFQANKAIGGLLMPRRLVETAAEPFLVAAGLLGLPVLPRERREEATGVLADVFDVNPAVARIRLEDLYPPNSGQLSL